MFSRASSGSCQSEVSRWSVRVDSSIVVKRVYKSRSKVVAYLSQIHIEEGEYLDFDFVCGTVLKTSV